MSRRRRTRDPAFGSDSFLDVIANLVGIVLILIVMVGGRVRELPVPSGPVEPPPPVVRDLTPEIECENARLNEEVREWQRRLLDTLKQLSATDAEIAQREREVRGAGELNDLLDRQGEQARQQRDAADQAGRLTESDISRLRDQRAELERATQDLQSRPRDQRWLRYHLPVSRPVDAEEVMFECQHGRVTHADVAGLLALVNKGLSPSANQLRTQWQVTDTVGPVGAFRLKYTVARQRDALDQGFNSLPPANDRHFQYGLSRWELVPAWPLRGETPEEALAGGSRFHQVVDAIDPEQTVLTLFVYPDSFETYRVLRDQLHERGFIVAGRPLPTGMAITGSRSGSRSRGQ